MTNWKTGYMPLIIGGIGAMASALLMPWLHVVGPSVGETRIGIEYRDLSRLVTRLDADFAAARLGFGIYAMGIGLAASVTGIVGRRALASRLIAQPVGDSSPL